jgi:aldehyde:ferredoxin oxidoreductase
MFKDNPLNKVLYIDLSKKHFCTEYRDDLFGKHIGGAGVAIQLLREECPEGIDPFGPENPIIFAVGPLTGLFPVASKTVAMFKSPHTGNLGESHAGGRSAISIRMAGYGAIVVKGASERPCYLAIHGNKVFFRDASSIWGMGKSITAGRIIRANEPSSGLRTIMRIGRAGEKLIPFACVTTETYRHFGRLGLGAIFGSKKLKAVVVSGKRSLPVSDMPDYMKLYDEIFNAATSSPVMKKYHDIGTPVNILPLNMSGGLPTRNLGANIFEDAEKISGEKLAEGHLGKRLACAHCPVGCIHIAALREPYKDEPYFYKTTMICYDYELIYAVGSMLGGSDAEGILKLIDSIEAYGLDCISTGVILAWATEAQEKGLVSEKETNGLKLQWGYYPAYIDAVRLIVEQHNDFYTALSKGVEHASSIYGGQDFALAFGKNEMSGYHTGPGSQISHLVGSRHSHLDMAGYAFDKKLMVDRNLSAAELASELLNEERWRQVLSSLVICFFAREVYKPDVIVNALKIAGLDTSEDELKRIGEKIHAEKYRFKLREGFSFDALRIPKRIFETPASTGMLDEQYVRKAIEHIKNDILNKIKVL